MLKHKPRKTRWFNKKFPINKKTSLTIRPLKGSAEFTYNINRKIHPSWRIKSASLATNFRGKIRPSTVIENPRRGLKFRIGRSLNHSSPLNIYRRRTTSVMKHKRFLPSGKIINVRKHKRKIYRKLL